MERAQKAYRNFKNANRAYTNASNNMYHARHNRSAVQQAMRNAFRDRHAALKEFINATKNFAIPKGLAPNDIKRALNVIAYPPVNISWNKLGNNIDPITMYGRVASETSIKWPKNGLAVEVKDPNSNKKMYHEPKAFNRWYGTTWRTMDPTSKNSISAKKHMYTQKVIPRNTVRLVRFTGPRFNTNTAARIIQTAVRSRRAK